MTASPRDTDLQIQIAKIRLQARNTGEFFNPFNFSQECRTLVDLWNPVFTKLAQKKFTNEDDRYLIEFFRSWISEKKDTTTVRAFCKVARRQQILIEANRLLDTLANAGEGLLVEDMELPARRIAQALWRTFVRMGRPRLVRVKDTSWEAPPAVHGSRKERIAQLSQGRNFSVV